LTGHSNCDYCVVQSIITTQLLYINAHDNIIEELWPPDPKVHRIFTLQAANDRRGKVLGKFAKVISILVALTMVVVVFAVFVPQSTAVTADTPRIADPVGIDIGPSIRDRPVDSISISEAFSNGPLGKYVFQDYYDVGDKGMYYDFDGSGWLEFEKRGEGNHCEVWVATDLNFEDGDPRNEFTSCLNISEGKVNYIIQQFDEVIFEIESENFGLPENHTGDNSLMEDYGFDYYQNVNGEKTMIMIFNIIDENYYDAGYPYYVVGYYSPTAELYYDRNIIHIDCWDWDNRTTGTSPRPFVYEGTVAHEYQHLLHDDADPDEASWINEGCSMYSEFICGYMVESEMWNTMYRFLYTPDNGLVDWGDQGDINILADYAQTMMFMMYLNDHFNGSEFISALFSNPDNGKDSVTSTLIEMGYDDWTFEDVFYNWRLANLIHSDEPGNGLYNYVSIDWSSMYSMEIYDGFLPYYFPGWGGWWMSELWGETWTYDGYNTGLSNVGSYGTDYVQILDLFSPDPLGLKLNFEGWTEVPEGWEITMKPFEGDPVWSEDFNHDGSFPAGWTTDSEGPDYWSWETYDEGDGDWAVWCSSDSAGSGTDITEWLYMYDTSIDMTDLENPMLQMYLEYNTYDGDDFARVIANAGYGWVDVETWYPGETVAGTVVVDMTEFAGEESVQLGFVYHGTWDWWMFVDDLELFDAEPDYAWYSGAGDLKDFKLVGEVDLTDAVNSTLEFDTYYYIEDYWDFGFVQVSTDFGQTWTSLENEYTVSDYDPNAHPAIIEQLPGLTGTSGEWMTMSFDLSAYDGQVIWIQFRYMTDWGYTEEGWWVDNIMVNGELLDNAETVIGFEPDFPATEWMVTIYAPANGGMPALIFDLNLNDQMETLRSIHALADNYPYVIMIVSPTTGMADWYLNIYNI
jgi:hypothetical protein